MRPLAALLLALCALLLLAPHRALGANTITLSTGTLQFANTLDLSSYANGRTLQLLYTLLPDGTLKGALLSDISASEYAGISFGQPHRSGSPTVIATTSFIDGYYLSGYSTSGCNAARGTYQLSQTTLEYDGTTGKLAGLFTASGISAGNQPIGYVFGPYSGGILQDHTRCGCPYGTMFGSLTASAAAPVASPSPGAAPVASPSPPPAAQSTTPSGSTPTSSAGSTTTPSSSPASESGQQSRARSPPPPRSVATAPAAQTTVPVPATSATPAAGEQQGVMGMTQWYSEAATSDWHLTIAFVISWVSAPGVLLMMWPFIFDAAVDVGSLFSGRSRGKAVDG